LQKLWPKLQKIFGLSNNTRHFWTLFSPSDISYFTFLGLDCGVKFKEIVIKSLIFMGVRRGGQERALAPPPPPPPPLLKLQKQYNRFLKQETFACHFAYPTSLLSQII